MLKQTREITVILEFNDRIQKFSGSRFATDRFSLVNRRGKNWRLNSCEIENRLSRCPQIPKSIANIRAESDCGSHFSSRHVERSRDIPRSNLNAAPPAGKPGLVVFDRCVAGSTALRMTKQIP